MLETKVCIWDLFIDMWKKNGEHPNLSMWMENIKFENVQYNITNYNLSKCTLKNAT